MVSANAVINKQYGMRNVRESAIFSYIASLSAAQLSEKKIWLACPAIHTRLFRLIHSRSVRPQKSRLSLLRIAFLDCP